MPIRTPEDFGAAIRRARKRQGMTQAEKGAVASKALKVHRVTPDGLVLLGSIDGETRSFCYDQAYLSQPDAGPISVALPPSRPFSAPAYDIVPATIYERFSTRLAMKMGDASEINEVTPRDILLVADAVGLPRKTVAKMARELPRQARWALHELQARCGDTGVAYWGDRLDGDMTARMDVLEAVDA